MVDSGAVCRVRLYYGVMCCVVLRYDVVVYDGMRCDVMWCGVVYCIVTRVIVMHWYGVGCVAHWCVGMQYIGAWRVLS